MNQIEQTYIIAEAGVNHNGSLDMAIALVDAAADAGANSVKFQTFKAERLVSKHAAKAMYQKASTGDSESQYEMLKKLELTEEFHHRLIRYCQQKSIDFLSSPFDMQSLDFLVHELQLKQIKISSGELTNAPLLLNAARADADIILSSGMSTLADIELALGVLAYGYMDKINTPTLAAIMEAAYSPKAREILQQKVCLLHCTTEYPAPFEDVNLNVMSTLRQAFGIPIGFSDHTSGISVPIAAAALGARVIEKHFTLDRTLPGPDHQASLEPDELKKMVQSIREVETSLGSYIKSPAPSEIKNMSIARKSLIAAMPIEPGQEFNEQNIAIKRPGTGISPFKYWEILGKKAERAYQQDEIIDP